MGTSAQYKKYGLLKSRRGKWFVLTIDGIEQYFLTLRARNELAATLLAQRVQALQQHLHRWEKVKYAERQNLKLPPFTKGYLLRCKKCGMLRYGVRDRPYYGIWQQFFCELFSPKWRLYKRLPPCQPFDLMGA